MHARTCSLHFHLVINSVASWENHPFSSMIFPAINLNVYPFFGYCSIFSQMFTHVFLWFPICHRDSYRGFSSYVEDSQPGPALKKITQLVDSMVDARHPRGPGTPGLWKSWGFEGKVDDFWREKTWRKSPTWQAFRLDSKNWPFKIARFWAMRWSGYPCKNRGFVPGL